MRPLGGLAQTLGGRAAPVAPVLGDSVYVILREEKIVWRECQLSEK